MKMKNRFEILKRMTGRYEEYLISAKQGGDWELHKLMMSIHDKIIDLEEEINTMIKDQ